MAVWSEVNLLRCSSDFRLDAEYYHPEVLHMRAAIAASPYPKVMLKDVSTSIINFGAYSLCNHITFQDDGIPFITAENIRDGYVEFTNCRFIPNEQHHRLLWKSKVSKGQVLVAMAARLGYAAVYNSDEPLNSSQDIAKITLADANITDPYYIASFINSRFGRGQLLAAQTGSVQQHTNLGRIKELMVIIPRMETQRTIAELFRQASECRMKSQSLHAEAEALLQLTLGLEQLDLQPHLFYERPYADLAAGDRFDAEYFQPPKKAILDVLAKLPAKSVGEQYRSVQQLWQPDKVRADEYVRNYDLTDALQPYLDESVDPTTPEMIASTKKSWNLAISWFRDYGRTSRKSPSSWRRVVFPWLRLQSSLCFGRRRTRFARKCCSCTCALHMASR